MNKNLLLLVAVILMVAGPVFGQMDSKQLCEKKIRSYSRMRTSGFVMAGIGSGLAIGGSVLLATAPGDHDDDDPDSAFDDGIDEVFQTFGGIVCLGVGIGLIAGGVTLGSIGSHKVGTYRKRLDNLSLGLNKQGLTLTYKF